MLGTYKKLLRNEIELNEELIDFINDCLKDIFYKENDLKIAQKMFNDALSDFNLRGCICYSLATIKNRIAERNKEQEGNIPQE